MDAITVFMETLKTYTIVPLKTDVLLFQTCYHVVAQILAEVAHYLLK